MCKTTPSSAFLDQQSSESSYDPKSSDDLHTSESGSDSEDSEDQQILTCSLSCAACPVPPVMCISARIDSMSC